MTPVRKWGHGPYSLAVIHGGLDVFVLKLALTGSAQT